MARFDKPGHRVTGSRIGQNSKVGFEYVHVCIDDHSRAAYVEVLDDETGDTCARFRARAVVWFASQGVTVRELGAPEGGTLGGTNNMMMMVLAFLVVFAVATWRVAIHQMRKRLID